MSRVDRRYLRVYFDDLERDHPDVWYDPTCLSTFVRLLALSEKAWPTMPEIPVSVRRADLAKLVAAGMIEYLPNHRFVLKGWVTERGHRAKVARENVDKRHSGSTDVGTDAGTDVPTVVLPPRAGASFSYSFSRDVTTEGGPGGTDADEAAILAFLARNGAAIRPESGFGQRLVRLVARRGVEAVMAKATALAANGPLSDRQWVFGLEQALETIPDPKIAERAQELAKAANRRNEGVWKRRIEAYRLGGVWDAEWGEVPA